MDFLTNVKELYGVVCFRQEQVPTLHIIDWHLGETSPFSRCFREKDVDGWIDLFRIAQVMGVQKRCVGYPPGTRYLADHVPMFNAILVYISIILVPISSMYGIFTYMWLTFMVDVGKYASPMDPMGWNRLEGRIVVHRPWYRWDRWDVDSQLRSVHFTLVGWFIMFYIKDYTSHLYLVKL